MKKIPLLAWLAVLTPAGFMKAQAAPDPLVGGAQFSLVECSGGTEKKLKADQPLTGPTQLRLHVKALNQRCVAVITGFQSPGSRWSKDFPPQVITLQGGKSGQVDFTVNRPLPTTNLYVTILSADLDQTSKIDDWANLWMSDPNQNNESRVALYRSVSDCYNKQDDKTPHSGPLPEALGGVRSISGQSGNNPQPSSSGGIAATNGKGARMEESSPATRRPEPQIKPDWTLDADYIACSKDRPAVFIYKVAMSSK